MSVTLAKADSTASSVSYYLQMTHRIKTLVFQITMNRSSPMCQNISYPVHFVPTTFVQPELPWSPTSIMGNMPQGCRDHAQFRCCVAHILIRPRDHREFSFSCRGKQGALLSLPIQAQREDTVVGDGFGKWMIEHIDLWFAWIRQKGLKIDRMEDIILVTGTDRTRSWANVAFLGGQADARVSFGVEVVQSRINWQFSPERKIGAVWNWRPNEEV